MTTNQQRLPKSQTRADFWLMLILFASFRLLTLLLLRPGGFIRDWSDFDTYLGVATLSDYGLFPYLDFWLEWPPVIPWLMVGAYKLSLLLPQWEDPRFWFITILGTVFLLFEVGNFALIYRLARRIIDNQAAVSRVLWMYALLFPPVYAMLGFFDGVALFFILLSLELILANKHNWAAFVSGVGFAVKLTPVLMAGPALWTIWHKYKPNWSRVVGKGAIYGAIFLATVALLIIPFWLTEPQWLAAAVRATLGRSSWETLWAVLEGYYGFGVVTGNRLNPAETNFAIHPATLPWGIISLFFALLYAALFFIKAEVNRPRRVVAFSGLTVVLFLLYSKGYSPQFLVYVLPFVILLLPNFAGVGYALVLTLLNLLEQPLSFVMLPDEHWLLTFVVTARFIIFVALAVEFSAQTFGLNFTFNIGRMKGSSFLRLIILGGVTLVAVGLIPRALGAYQQAQLQKHPHQAEIAFLQTQANPQAETLIFTEQALYRQFYPFLKDDFELKLAGGDVLFPGAPGVDNLIADESTVWLLSTGAAGTAIQAELEGLLSAAESYQLEGLGTLTQYGPETITPLGQADNGLELLSYQMNMPTSTVRMILFWHTTQPLTTDYTVFTQLLDSSGQLIASHDSPPANGIRPTSSWLPGDVIADSHPITLPEDLPPGEYQLVAGMYDSSGIRLPFPADVIVLGEVALP